MKDYAEKHPLKKIVFGHGVDWANVGGKNPGPEILDQVISDRPVIIVHASRRQAWLNTMALVFTALIRNMFLPKVIGAP